MAQARQKKQQNLEIPKALLIAEKIDVSNVQNANEEDVKTIGDINQLIHFMNHMHLHKLNVILPDYTETKADFREKAEKGEKVEVKPVLPYIKYLSAVSRRIDHANSILDEGVQTKLLNALEDGSDEKQELQTKLDKLNECGYFIFLTAEELAVVAQMVDAMVQIIRQTEIANLKLKEKMDETLKNLLEVRKQIKSTMREQLRIFGETAPSDAINQSDINGFVGISTLNTSCEMLNRSAIDQGHNDILLDFSKSINKIFKQKIVDETHDQFTDVSITAGLPVSPIGVKTNATNIYDYFSKYVNGDFDETKEAVSVNELLKSFYKFIPALIPQAISSACALSVNFASAQINFAAKLTEPVKGAAWDMYNKYYNPKICIAECYKKNIEGIVKRNDERKAAQQPHEVEQNDQNPGPRGLDESFVDLGNIGKKKEEKKKEEKKEEDKKQEEIEAVVNSFYVPEDERKKLNAWKECITDLITELKNEKDAVQASGFYSVFSYFGAKKVAVKEAKIKALELLKNTLIPEAATIDHLKRDVELQRVKPNVTEGWHSRTKRLLNYIKEDKTPEEFRRLHLKNKVALPQEGTPRRRFGN